MKIFGTEESDQNIINHVLSYEKGIQQDKNSRFSRTLKIIRTECNNNNKDEKILDYGCGWGSYSVALNKIGYQVDAIDLSKNEIDICKLVWSEKHPQINFKNTQISTFDKNSYNLVLSSQVIEHVHNVGNYLSQINRVLKKDGQLIISLPNILTPRFILPLMAGKKRVEKNIKKRNISILKNYQKGNDHINAWDPLHFSALLATLGFEVEQFIPMEGLAMPRHKPFKPYWKGPLSKIKIFESYSYSMLFICKKMNDCVIENND